MRAACKVGATVRRLSIGPRYIKPDVPKMENMPHLADG
jgi:hypothetical protein